MCNQAPAAMHPAPRRARPVPAVLRRPLGLLVLLSLVSSCRDVLPTSAPASDAISPLVPVT
jgi:hypothetical protein